MKTERRFVEVRAQEFHSLVSKSSLLSVKLDECRNVKEVLVALS